jgi:hypothetical protein
VGPVVPMGQAHWPYTHTALCEGAPAWLHAGRASPGLQGRPVQAAIVVPDGHQAGLGE